MLGVHFAVTPQQERSFLEADGDDETVSELLEDMEENWSDDRLTVHTDKAWDAMHRCLTDGTLDPDGGDYPLSHTVLGGRQLNDAIYVVHVGADQVRDVTAALTGLDRIWLRSRFDTIASDYTGALDEQDFEYTWSNFVDVRTFYERAAASGRAVLFTAT